MFVSLVHFVGVLVLGVDQRKVTCLSSFVTFEAAWHQPSLFDGCLVLRKPIVVVLFRKAFSKIFREKEFG